MADIEVTDLCDQRAEDGCGFVLTCTEPLGHGSWHYDPLADVTWHRGRVVALAGT